jgi:acyl carrier protein
MTNDADLRRDLKALLVKRLRLHGVDPESIGDDDPLVKGPLGLDSIDILELALAVEEVYGFKIADEEVGQAAFRSLGSLAEFVSKRRQAAPANPRSA